MEHQTDLAVTAIAESATNPRRHFDSHKLQELAESIRSNPLGVVEPLVVRPKVGKNGFTHELVVGARRLRAAKIAGRETVPVRIADLTDEQVLEIQVVENLQREDVHPLEEAEGYERLLKIKGYTAEVIAEKIGKDRSYVYKRIQLARLIEPLKGSFLKEEIHIGHALLLSRLSEADQIRASKEALWERRWQRRDANQKEAVEVRDLEDWIHNHVLLSLSAAPWPKDDAELVPAAGSCISCSKRTGANLALFDDLKKGDDRCLDAKCYEAKRHAYLAREIKRADDVGSPLLKIAVSWQNKLPKDVLDSGSYRRIDETTGHKTCASTEEAIVVAGERDLGRRVKICRDKKCRVHNYYSASRERSFSEVWEQKKAELDNRINRETRIAMLNAIVSKTKEIGRRELDWLARIAIDLHGYDARKVLAELLEVEIPKGDEWKSSQHITGAVVKKSGAEFHRALIMIALVGDIHPGDLKKSDKDDPDEILAIAAHAHKIDPKALQKKIAAPLLADFNKKRLAAKNGSKKKAKS